MNNNFLKYYLFIVLLISLTISINSKSYSQQYTEYEVKVAYIYNFIKFIQWPNTAFETENSPFIIGIYGTDPFDTIINNAFNERTLYDRKWIKINFSNSDEITKCHLLFVAEADQFELIKIFEKTKKYNILTIGNNIENFCENGGIINFTKKTESRRFEINNEAAVRAKLNISSKLLSLSKIIKENENRF